MSAVGSCDVCGGAAAFMSMLGFGSFGAPIKSEAAKSVDVDPLVFQSYKTAMCFLTSWLVLALGEPLAFTPWGIASACFWVPSGVAAIAGIKLAGLAVAMGVLSSCIVLVSFVWGIFIFDERIHSREMACLAVALMMMGLMGMSYYSAPKQVPVINNNNTANDNHRINEESPENSAAGYNRLHHDDNSDENKSEEEDVERPFIQESHDSNTVENETPDQYHDALECPVEIESYSIDTHDDNNHSNLQEPLLPAECSGTAAATTPATPVSQTLENNSDTIVINGVVWKRRTLGIICSVFCGIWGGSIMAPEKMAKSDTSGIGYLISFGIGAALVTLVLWMIRFAYHWVRLQSAKAAYQALPSFHFRVMCVPGCTGGLLWSIGNFFSLISVKYLGEGVGYSVTQSAMLVSGLWGIFYFKEITGTEKIWKWFLSAGLTITGIILLSYEHHEK